jgi:glucokinase
MSVIGVSLSGANIKVGRVNGHNIEKNVDGIIEKEADKFKILDQICDFISQVYNNDIEGIGFGVNSVVDVEKGIVFNVKHFPSWNRVHLKDHLEKKFKIPVYVNNVCNCFAIGEKYFGTTKRYSNSVGLLIGTGVGAGIIINNKLYSGNNCMAGEFGKISYKDHDIEYYCSENFFKTIHSQTSELVYDSALRGKSKAIEIFEEYGHHLGNAVKTILYSVDPDIIVLGGLFSKYFDLFEESMWESIREFVFPQSLKNLIIQPSKIENISVFGAAAVFLDAAR